jgi:hypothetical protein
VNKDAKFGVPESVQRGGRFGLQGESYRGWVGHDFAGALGQSYFFLKIQAGGLVVIESRLELFELRPRAARLPNRQNGK